MKRKNVWKIKAKHFSCLFSWQNLWMNLLLTIVCDCVLRMKKKLFTIRDNNFNGRFAWHVPCSIYDSLNISGNALHKSKPFRKGLTSISYGFTSFRSPFPVAIHCWQVLSFNEMFCFYFLAKPFLLIQQ